MDFDQILGPVKANPLIWGSVLVFIGSLCRNLPAWIWQGILRCSTISLDVPNTDSAFEWLSVWLNEHPYAKKAKHLTVSSDMNFDRYSDTAHLSKYPKVYFSPAPGQHLIKFAGKWVWLSRHRDDQPGSGSVGVAWSMMRPKETITLRLVGRDSSLIKSLMIEAMKQAYDSRSEGVGVMISDREGIWRTAFIQEKRSLDSVLLPGDQLPELIADVKQFLADGEWYKMMNVPYRRGYLLYGEPGTGKSTTILAVASHFECSVYSLNLNDAGMSDKILLSLLTQVPPGSIVLLEDVDAVFKKRVGSDDNNNTVTFSGLLNALDGISASHGRLLFMTTNHLELLDDALIRPGRVDYRLYMGLAKTEQSKAIFARFFADESEESADEFATLVGDETVSMAAIQGFLLEHRNRPVEAKRDVHIVVERDREIKQAVEDHKLALRTRSSSNSGSPVNAPASAPR